MRTRLSSVVTAILVLGACGGRDEEQGAAGLQPVVVTVTGLGDKPVTLVNGGKDALTITSPETQGTFAERLPVGATYDVTVSQHPIGPSQLCTVTNGKGTVSAAPVAVSVDCVAAFTVVGGVVDLTGTGLVLQNLGGDDLPVSPDPLGAHFAFPTPMVPGSTYAVTVKSNPTNPLQTCSVEDGSGTIGAAHGPFLGVRCVTTPFKLSGTVTGALGKMTLSVTCARADGGENVDHVEVAGGATSFSADVLSGDACVVAVEAQPSAPAQKCTVTNGSATITNANVTNVAVSCAISSFPVSMRARDLTGAGLVVKSGNDVLQIDANGDYAFPTAILSGQPFEVSVVTPAANGASCALYGATGTVGGTSPVVYYGCGKPRRVFVTSATWLAGALGGLGGANAKCQQLATNAGLTGTFKAWLSDDNNSPSTQFTRSEYLPWQLVDGTLVAANWTALTSGTLAHAIDKTETGGAPPTSTILTHTMPDGSGVLEKDSYGTCEDWTSTGRFVPLYVGSPTSPGSAWTSSAFTGSCDSQVALYCFEQ